MMGIPELSTTPSVGIPDMKMRGKNQNIFLKSGQITRPTMKKIQNMFSRQNQISCCCKAVQNGTKFFKRKITPRLGHWGLARSHHLGPGNVWVPAVPCHEWQTSPREYWQQSKGRVSNPD